MIQKIIHQIWVGPKALPERDAGWCYGFKQMNPTWTHRLYGNEILEEFAGDPYVKHLQMRGSPLAFLTDRLRVLVLQKYGGIYIDCDAEPLRPLDTLKFWDRPDLDFVYGLRRPWREGVALFRGIALVDNTVLASRPGGRMIERILDCWIPQQIEVTGHRIGLQILAHTREDCAAMGYEYFYDMTPGPNAIISHDCHNLGSWCRDTPKVPVCHAGETLKLSP